MNRRRRTCAGFVAIVALTFSFAETVWASTCAPAMGTPAEAAFSSEHVPTDPDCMSHVPAGGTRHGDDDEGPQCPFGPTAAAEGCMASATLPGRPAQAPTLSPDASSAVLSAEGKHDLLLQTALFHPPRA